MGVLYQPGRKACLTVLGSPLPLRGSKKLPVCLANWQPCTLVLEYSENPLLLINLLSGSLKFSMLLVRLNGRPLSLTVLFMPSRGAPLSTVLRAMSTHVLSVIRVIARSVRVPVARLGVRGRDGRKPACARSPRSPRPALAKRCLQWGNHTSDPRTSELPDHPHCPNHQIARTPEPFSPKTRQLEPGIAGW